MPWYVNVGLIVFILVCFRGVWSSSSKSGFPAHRLHPVDVANGASREAAE
jgi:hypothetical protein